MSIATTLFGVLSKARQADSTGDVFVTGVGHIPRDIYKYVDSNPYGDLPRYSPHIVIQHLLVFSSFLVLSSTGVPLYFSDEFWAPAIIGLYGGIDNAMAIHRIAAYVMIFASVYHLVTILGGTGWKLLLGRFDYRRTQIPRLKDLVDLIQDMRYFLGRTPHRPLMEKFMYKQKLHYLAIIWGTAVLTAAGLALLLPDQMAAILPDALISVLPEKGLQGRPAPSLIQDIARVMHADEAVMALIVLAFWHWGNVHFVPGRFPCQWTFLTGKITREHQIEEHFLEYIRNLEEIPEERRYMRALLTRRGYPVDNRAVIGAQAVPMEDLPRVL
jgi:thiosulfate reductase cytochrome b subunit